MKFGGGIWNGGMWNGGAGVVLPPEPTIPIFAMRGIHRFLSEMRGVTSILPELKGNTRILPD